MSLIIDITNLILIYSDLGSNIIVIVSQESGERSGDVFATQTRVWPGPVDARLTPYKAQSNTGLDLVLKGPQLSPTGNQKTVYEPTSSFY